MKITQEALTGTFEQKKELVSQFNLMDDDFFAVVMQDKDACEYVIRKLTGKEDLKIIESLFLIFSDFIQNFSDNLSRNCADRLDI